MYRLILLLVCTAHCCIQVVGFTIRVNVHSNTYSHRTSTFLQTNSQIFDPSTKSFSQNFTDYFIHTNTTKLQSISVQDVSTTESKSSLFSTHDATLSADFQLSDSNETFMKEIDSTLNEKLLASIFENLPRFIVRTRRRQNNSKQYIVLWRSLVEDCSDLIGFPVSYIASQVHTYIHNNAFDINQNQKNSSSEITNEDIDWKVLPYLDTYSFEPGGGISGFIFGATGVAEGTRIYTTPVGDVQTTLPRNYVQTEDGYFYELGKPDFKTDSTTQEKTIRRSYSLNGLSPSIVSEPGSFDLFYSDLWRVGSLTLLVLGGASIVQSLSHHLTVNVFWV